MALQSTPAKTTVASNGSKSYLFPVNPGYKPLLFVGIGYGLLDALNKHFPGSVERN